MLWNLNKQKEKNIYWFVSNYNLIIKIKKDISPIKYCMCRCTQILKILLYSSRKMSRPEAKD